MFSLIERNSQNFDNIFNQLQNGLKKSGRQINMHREDLELICMLTRSQLLSEPMLLEVNAPVRIVGDVHGQYVDLLNIFTNCGYPPKTKYLFLGDYVDRGANSIETITILLLLKLKYPKKIYLLRGNHESDNLNVVYGFFDECKRRYNIKLWKTFVNCYNCLPVAAIVGRRIFCCHGGLSPDLIDLDQIKKLTRPTEIPEKGLLCDLLWSDPDNHILGFQPNSRGVSVIFGSDVVDRFCLRHGFDMVCRAHQVVEDGYEFFAKRQLITIFSAPNYCGMFDNAGATMNVDENLVVSFQITPPKRLILHAILRRFKDFN